MVELIVLAAIVAFFLFQLYLAGKDKDGFLRRFSRGAYMRDLNEKMDKSISDKK